MGGGPGGPSGIVSLGRDFAHRERQQFGEDAGTADHGECRGRRDAGYGYCSFHSHAFTDCRINDQAPAHRDADFTVWDRASTCLRHSFADRHTDRYTDAGAAGGRHPHCRTWQPGS